MSSPVFGKHDQRIQTLQNALTALNALPADPTRQQLIPIIQALLEEVIALHNTLVSIPSPPWSKQLD
jgi:hypothetical protein